MMPEEGGSYVINGRTFRVSQDIRTVELEKVRENPEAGLTGTGSADNQHVLVPGVGRILRAV